VDGRASRGPGRAVGDTRQSTMVDLGVAGGPRGFRRVLGPPVHGRRFWRISTLPSFLLLPGWEAVVNFRHPQIPPVGGGP
jgi:hypothetical protein